MQIPPQQPQPDRVYPIIQQPRRSHTQRSLLIGGGVSVALAIAVILLAVFVFGVGQAVSTSRQDPRPTGLGPTQVAQARATQTAAALATPLPTVVVPPAPATGATPTWHTFFSWYVGVSSTSGRLYIPPHAQARMTWTCTTSDNLGGSSCIIQLSRYLSAAETGSATGATQQIPVADTQGNAHGTYTFTSSGVYAVQANIGIGDSGNPSENVGVQVQIYQ